MATGGSGVVRYLRRGGIVVYNNRLENGVLKVSKGSGESISDEILYNVLWEHRHLFISGLQGSGKTWLAQYLVSRLVSELEGEGYNVVAVYFSYRETAKPYIKVDYVSVEADGQSYGPFIVINAYYNERILAFILRYSIYYLLVTQIGDKELRKKIAEDVLKKIKRKVEKKARSRLVNSLIEITGDPPRALEQIFNMVMGLGFSVDPIQLMPAFIIKGLIDLIKSLRGNKKWRGKIENVLGNLHNTVVIIAADDLRDLVDKKLFLEKLGELVSELESIGELRSLYTVYCYRLPVSPAHGDLYIRYIRYLVDELPYIDTYSGLGKITGLPVALLDTIKVKQLQLYERNKLFPAVYPDRELAINILSMEGTEYYIDNAGDREKITCASFNTPAIAVQLAKLYRGGIISQEQLESLEKLYRDLEKPGAQFIDNYITLWRTTINQLYKIIVQTEPSYPILLNAPLGLGSDTLGLAILYTGLILSYIVYGEPDQQLMEELKKTTGYNSIEELLSIYKDDYRHILEEWRTRGSRYRDYIKTIVQGIKNRLKTIEIELVSDRKMKLPLYNPEPPITIETDSIEEASIPVYRLAREFTHYSESYNELYMGEPLGLKPVVDNVAKLVHTVALSQAVKAFWDYTIETNTSSMEMIRYILSITGIYEGLRRIVDENLVYKLLLTMANGALVYPIVAPLVIGSLPEPPKTMEPQTITLAQKLAYRILNSVKAIRLPWETYIRYKEKILEKTLEYGEGISDPLWGQVIDDHQWMLDNMEALVLGGEARLKLPQNLENILKIITKPQVYMDIIEKHIEHGEYGEAEKLLGELQKDLKELRGLEWRKIDQVSKGLLEAYYSPLDPGRQLLFDKLLLAGSYHYLRGLLNINRYCLEDAGAYAKEEFLEAIKYSIELVGRGWPQKIRDALVAYSLYLGTHIVCSDKWVLEELKEYLDKTKVRRLDNEASIPLVEAWRTLLEKTLENTHYMEMPLVNTILTEYIILNTLLGGDIEKNYADEFRKLLSTMERRVRDLFDGDQASFSDIGILGSEAVVFGCMILDILGTIGGGDNGIIEGCRSFLEELRDSIKNKSVLVIRISRDLILFLWLGLKLNRLDLVSAVTKLCHIPTILTSERPVDTFDELSKRISCRLQNCLSEKQYPKDCVREVIVPLIKLWYLIF